MNPSVEFVRYALTIGAIEFVPEGRRLASGRLSPYFFNSGLFHSGPALEILSAEFAELMSEHFENADVIYGLAYSSIAIAVATVQNLAGDSWMSLSYSFNRKEAKNHGEGGRIVGSSLQGKKVVIVDDTITSGSSLDDAVEIVRSEGGTPIGCIVAFDRQELGTDGKRTVLNIFSVAYGIPVYSVARFADLVTALKNPAHLKLKDVDPTVMLQKISEYNLQYGV